MKKFSVVILHYNQPQFILQALDSVLSQDYDNIELILADDHSDVFDERMIESYIQRNKKDNIRNFAIVRSEENSGTVGNINRGLAAATGEYVLFFAADDTLFEIDTISRFAEELQILPDNEYIVSGQCMMYDNHLIEMQWKYVDERLAVRLNQQTARKQYEALTNIVVYAMGATAFKRTLFDLQGNFDPQYKFIEDWSYFLKSTRNGYSIKFVPFPALKHRDGGVSHNLGNKNLPYHVVKFHDDLLLIMEKEIMPYINSINHSSQIDFFLDYYKKRKDLYEMAGRTQRLSIFKIIWNNPKVHLKMLIFFWINNMRYIAAGAGVAAFLSGAAFSLLYALREAIPGNSTWISLVWGILAGGSLFLSLGTIALWIAYHSYRRFIKKGRLAD